MISVYELSLALQNEKRTGELLSLPNDFYKNLQNSYPEAQDSNEHGSLVKLSEGLKKRRIQKLLIYLAYGKTLPKPIPEEEEDLYIQIKNIIDKTAPEAKPIKMKISKKIPTVITPSGSSIGPFEQDETVYLTNITDIKFIVDNKIGEIAES